MNRLKGSVSRSALAAVLVLGTSVALQDTYAQARTLANMAQAARSYDFNIPAKPLLNALVDFTAATNVQIVRPSAEALSGTSQAVVGSFTADAALRQLLAGSGLIFQFTDANTATLTRARGTVVLPPVTVEEVGLNDMGRTEGSGSYTIQSMNNATKLSLAPRETPQSVSVITRQRMDDEGMATLDDALASATGIRPVLQAAGTEPIARGFPISTYRMDGVPTVRNASAMSSADLIAYDRVEVLRGAAGLLDGAGDPGGSINLARKKPTRDFQASSAVSGGSWDTYRAEGDISGPLNQTESVRGRIAAGYEEADSFVKHITNERKTFYGVIEADVAASTLVTAGVHAQTQDGTVNLGLPFYSNGQDIGLPRDTYLGTNWNYSDKDSTIAFAELKQGIVDGWTAKLNVNQIWADSSSKYGYASGAINPVTLAGSNLTGAFNQYNNNQTGVDGYLTGPFELFGNRHELVMAATATRDHFLIATRVAALGQPVNVFNWNPATYPEPNLTPSVLRDEETLQYGAYATGKFKLAEPLTLILGSRLSWWEFSSERTAVASGAKTYTGYEIDAEITPYAGLVYDVNGTYSIYASYADIFQPQNAIDSSGGLLPPVIGANYETGVKGEFFDGQLNASLAFFRIDQTNRAQSDISGPSPCPYTGATFCSVAAGEVRSQGIELEISGALTPNWQLFGGYTYNTTEYIKDSVSGGRPFDVRTPKHLFRLSTMYRFDGDLSRWSVGGSIAAQSSYGAVASERLTQEAFAVANLAVSYQLTENVTARLNVNNIFDESYYAALGNSESVQSYYGEPRSVMLGLRAEW